jgi:hypothetical protein
METWKALESARKREKDWKVWISLAEQTSLKTTISNY